MIATIQPRHVRLWVAARSGDWSFAAYELGNLKGAFDRLGRAHPVEHEIPLQEMILSVTSQPFEDMHKAIESKDRVAFSKAFGDLTSACNAMRPQTMAWSSFGRRRTHQSQTRTLSARPLRNSGPRAFWIGDFDTNCVRRLGPSDTEDDALVSFEQTLTDWFIIADKY